MSIRGASTLVSCDDSGNHRLAINKSQAADTASVRFQSNWTGHAELVMTGDNNFHLKVSSDGTNWKQALRAELNTGSVEVPNLRSDEVTILNDSVAALPIPRSGGMLCLIINDTSYPQPAHSGIFAYDVGLSPTILTLAAGPGMASDERNQPDRYIGGRK